MSNEEQRVNLSRSNDPNWSANKYDLDQNRYSPAHIANYFLLRAREDGSKITPMKLIKLVYIAYGWYLVLSGRRLFSEKIEAWRYGPVIPSLYHEFKRFGAKPIEGFAVDYSGDDAEISYPIAEDSKVQGIANMVWKFYKDKSGAELSRITHEENSAWEEAWERRDENPELKDSWIAARSAKGIKRFLQN